MVYFSVFALLSDDSFQPWHWSSRVLRIDDLKFGDIYCIATGFIQIYGMSSFAPCRSRVSIRQSVSLLDSGFESRRKDQSKESTEVYCRKTRRARIYKVKSVFRSS